MKYEGEIGKKQVVKALFWKFMERLSVQGMNLVVQIILARILAPEDFGSLAIIVAITNFAALFVQSGLATVITQREEVDRKDISTFLTSSLAVAAVLYCAIYLLAPHISAYYDAPELKWALRVQALILFLNSFNSIQTAVLSRKMQFRTIFLRSLIAVPLSGVIGIGLAICGCGIWSLVIHNIVNMLAIVVFMSFDSELRFPLGFSFRRLKKHFGFSLKILLASLISSTHDTIRTMIVGGKYTKEELAYYDKALTYSAYVTQTINASIQSVLLPTFSSKQNNLSELQGVARNAVRLSMFVMFPVLIGVVMVCRPLVLVLLTEKWAGCIPYLMLFCILRIPGCMTSVDKQVYYAIGNSGVNFWYELGLFVVNLTVLAFTMQQGVMAIAIGATVVELIGGVVICCISAVQYGYSLKDRVRDILPSVICTGIMAISVWSISRININNVALLIAQIIVGVLSYAVASMLLNQKCVKSILHIVKK